jgi:hypothetical protein
MIGFGALHGKSVRGVQAGVGSKSLIDARGLGKAAGHSGCSGMRDEFGRGTAVILMVARAGLLICNRHADDQHPL